MLFFASLLTKNRHNSQNICANTFSLSIITSGTFSRALFASGGSVNRSEQMQRSRWNTPRVIFHRTHKFSWRAHSKQLKTHAIKVPLDLFHTKRRQMFRNLRHKKVRRRVQHCEKGGRLDVSPPYRAWFHFYGRRELFFNQIFSCGFSLHLAK